MLYQCDCIYKEYAHAIPCKIYTQTKVCVVNKNQKMYEELWKCMNNMRVFCTRYIL